MSTMAETTIFSETDDDGDRMAVYHFGTKAPALFFHTTSDAENVDSTSVAVRVTRGSVERLRDELSDWLGDAVKEGSPPEFPGSTVFSDTASPIDPVREWSLDRAMELHGPGTEINRVLSSAALVEEYLRGPKPRPVPAEPVKRRSSEPVNWFCTNGCGHRHLRGTYECQTVLRTGDLCECRETWKS